MSNTGEVDEAGGEDPGLSLDRAGFDAELARLDTAAPGLARLSGVPSSPQEIELAWSGWLAAAALADTADERLARASTVALAALPNILKLVRRAVDQAFRDWPQGSLTSTQRRSVDQDVAAGLAAAVAAARECAPGPLLALRSAELDTRCSVWLARCEPRPLPDAERWARRGFTMAGPAINHALLAATANDPRTSLLANIGHMAQEIYDALCIAGHRGPAAAMLGELFAEFIHKASLMLTHPEEHLASALREKAARNEQGLAL